MGCFDSITMDARLPGQTGRLCAGQTYDLGQQCGWYRVDASGALWDGETGERKTITGTLSCWFQEHTGVQDAFFMWPFGFWKSERIVDREWEIDFREGVMIAAREVDPYG